jgi:hypothetical protein
VVEAFGGRPVTRIVKVLWHDAHAEGGSWICAADIDPEPYSVVTVGWLVEDAKADHVVVAQSSGCDGQIDHVLAIPVDMVQRIVDLRE